MRSARDTRMCITRECINRF